MGVILSILEVEAQGAAGKKSWVSRWVSHGPQLTAPALPTHAHSALHTS